MEEKFQKDAAQRHGLENEGRSGSNLGSAAQLF
jgi:hypothetical protein